MTATVEQPTSTASPAPPTPPITGPAQEQTGSGARRRDRGRLVLEKKVIERIAAQAASESGTGQTGGVSGGLLGFGASTDLSARPQTTVELVERTATVDITLTVAYPTPIRAATRQVRRHVMGRVHELTGVEVTRVDITVTALSLNATTGPAVQ